MLTNPLWRWGSKSSKEYLTRVNKAGAKSEIVVLVRSELLSHMEESIDLRLCSLFVIIFKSSDWLEDRKGKMENWSVDLQSSTTREEWIKSRSSKIREPSWFLALILCYAALSLIIHLFNSRVEIWSYDLKIDKDLI